MADVTFAEALAALTAALGEPTTRPSRGFACWQPDRERSVAAVCLYGDGADVWVALFRDDLHDPGTTYALDGRPRPDAPLTPLPDAVAAATRWLREGGGAWAPRPRRARHA